MLKEEYKIYEEKMKKSIDSVSADFASVRAGRANASVLDRIMVDYYGSPTPIQQIAAISSPDPRALVLSTENGKINLSIKKALPQQERPAPRGPRPMTQRPAAARPAGGPPRHARSPQQTLPPSADQSFEDKLKQFLSSSEGKMADLNRSIDGKRGGRRRR